MTDVKLLSKEGLEYLIEKIDAQLESKVNVVDGKNLSTNDYTNAEKTKLLGVADGAQVNVIEGISVNGSPITPISKVINIDIETITNEEIDNLFVGDD